VKVLLTGSSGFIGQRLRRELASLGHEVHGLEGSDARSQEVDIRDAERVAAAIAWFSPDVVYHLAAVSGPMVAPTNPRLVAEVNCVGTINVLEAARNAGARRVIYASSISGFDGGSSADPQPLTVYGASKRFCEMLIRQYREAQVFEATSVRIGSVYGSGRKSADVLDRMVNDARSTSRIKYREGCTVPLIHVQDCAGYLAGLGSATSLAESYDLVTQTLEESELAAIVAEVFNAEVRVSESLGDAPRFPRPFGIQAALDATGRVPAFVVLDALKEMSDVGQRGRD